MMKLPNDFCEAMKSILKEDYDVFLDSYLSSPSRGILYHSLFWDRDSFLDAFPYTLSPIPYAENGFYLLDDVKIGNHPLHHAGAIYVQEPSAMCVINSVEIKKGDWILDFCAAPGGKSIGIAMKLCHTGMLMSNEINPKRARVLLGNMERMGIRNAVITQCSPEEISAQYHGVFDKVFVDTPCSGEGMFRKNPEAIREWSLELVSECSKRSLDILEHAHVTLKKGGYLIYSTCTFAFEENEAVIEAFLKKHSYRIIDVVKEVQEYTVSGIATLFETEKTRRFYPHIGKGEGQYIAVLEKLEDQDVRYPNGLEPLSSEFKKKVETVLEDTLVQKIPLFQYHDNIVTSLNSNFPILDRHVLSAGVKVGEFIHHHFVFHHQFFTSYGNLFCNQLHLEVDDKRVLSYLSGDEIVDETVKDGWGVLFVGCSPLGGFKASHGRLKNHYPKGLRKTN